MTDGACSVEDILDTELIICKVCEGFFPSFVLETKMSMYIHSDISVYPHEIRFALLQPAF